MGRFLPRWIIFKGNCRHHLADYRVKVLFSHIYMPVLKKLSVFLLLLCFNLLAQDKETDSLLTVIKNGKPKEKTDALNALSITVIYNDPAKAKQLAMQAISVSEAAAYKEGEGKAYIRLGIVYDVTGNYDSSVICYNIALDICLKAKNDKGAGSVYNNLGLICSKQGKLHEAIIYYLKALPCFEKIDNKQMLANVYNNLSLVYEKTKDRRLAITSAFKALNYYKELNDEENIGGTYTNLSVSYSNNLDNDSAIYFIKKAIDCHLKTNNLYGLSTAYNNYGGIFTERKEYGKARDYYFKALVIKEQLNENEGIASTNINLAGNYSHMGDRKNELRCLLKAFNISMKEHMQNEILMSSGALAEFYKNIKNADSVYYYITLHNAAKDSVYSKGLNTSLAEAQTRYKTKEKELTITSQQYQLSRKNYYIIGLLSFLLLVTLLFYTFYNRYRFKQKNKLQQEIIRQQDIATKAVIRAEENERRRVASDLHDSVGQMLSAIKINLSAFRSVIPEDNAARFEKIMDMADESCKEVRAISHNMMPNSLLKHGLISAIREFIEQLDQAALKINIETAGLNERMDDDVETVLYRVVQECVNNVVKHAHASRLDIQLVKDSEGIAITIEDNGAGFNTSVSREGIGLKNLASRIDFLKGTVDISSAEGKGTLIAIFIPSQNKS